MSGGSPLAEGADILRALGAYVVQGLALEALYDSGGCWGFGSVRDNDGVVAGSGLHNHLQSSRECNTSSTHSRSTLLDRPSPASLSQHSIMTISFSWGKGRCSSRVMWEGVGSLSQLGSGVNGSIGGGKGICYTGCIIKSLAVHTQV